MQKNRKRRGLMKKVLYYAALAILTGVFLFSAYKVGTYFLEQKRSQTDTEEVKQYMQVVPAQTGDSSAAVEQAPIAVDFEAMKAVNKDIVAWLYVPDTRLNYPIVQAADNDYYLHRLLNGDYNLNGTIFMDYLNHADFSDANTLIFGHNMKSGNMFGEMTNYKKQSYYDQHPVAYLLTPTQNYTLELVAGVILNDDDAIYQHSFSQELLDACRSHSTFSSNVEATAQDRFVTLSTCSYEYDNARFVVLGKLVPLGS